MARIFITGSSAGLGQLAAQSLVDQGHQVVLHARNEKRANDAKRKVPAAQNVLIGDLANADEIRRLATHVNASERFDVVIHNAGVYRTSTQEILAVNTLAPYMLTCLIQRPKRLIYLSSGMHKHGEPSLEKIVEGEGISYSDSKLHMVILAKAIARKWPEVYANAVDPGWVPTKMGGAGAPGDLGKGVETQIWLAVSNDNKAKVSGRYFYHKREVNYNSKADDAELQEEFLTACEQVTGVRFPAG